MSDIAPYLISTGHVELPEGEFLIPIMTTRERFDMIISSLLVGGEIVYSEEEILHYVDFLDALPRIRKNDVVYPNHATIFPHAFKTINGGFSPPVYLSSVWLSQYCLMTGLDAEASIEIPLQAGDYTVNMMYVKGSNVGDLTAYIDGVSLGTAAGYSATSVNSTWSWIANDLTEGLHELRLKITGKQPSSSAYNAALSLVYVRINS